MIVFELFQDLREHDRKPEDPTCLLLPLWTKLEAQEFDENHWWIDYAEPLILNCVPWSGRGLLAKTAMVGHAIVSKLSRLNLRANVVANNGFVHRHDYYRQFRELINNMELHRLGIEAGINSIQEVILFAGIDVGYYDLEPEAILKILNWMVHERKPHYLESVPLFSESERISILIKKARTDQQTAYFKVSACLKAASLDPLMKVTDTWQSILNTLKQFHIELGDDLNEDPCNDVSGMRLSGDQSKKLF
jgi:hypothetical protein